MARVLILFAHPAFEKSRVHRALVRQAVKAEGVTFRDLYELYPDYDIDVDREQSILLEHDIIVMQHPFYWYSCPAILKQWQDLVLEHGWAYGRGGTRLAGKYMMNVISAGGREDVYQSTGHNRFTVRQFLSPFDQTAHLCKMTYLPPFVVHDTHRMEQPKMEEYASRYLELLTGLTENRISLSNLDNIKYMNDLVPFTRALNN